MIFHFPDFDTLRLALTSGVVPPAISLAPAIGGIDDAGRPWLQPSVKPTSPMTRALAKLRIATPKTFPSPGVEFVNWLQALPVERNGNSLHLSKETTVLFELPEAALLPVVVGEMMRLSNDRQSFRWLKNDETNGTVLLRVVGPPYYTLLRALDREMAGTKAQVRAFVERAPRVWI